MLVQNTALITERSQNVRETFGRATLSGGQAAVTHSSATADSLVYVTNVNPDLENGFGDLTVTVIPGTGFVINSTVAEDTSEVAWRVVDGADF